MLLQPKMKHPIVKLLLSCIYSKTIFFTFSATDFMRTPFPCSRLNPVSSNMLHKTLLHIDSCGCVLCIDILYMKVINSSLRCSFLLIGLFLPYFFKKCVLHSVRKPLWCLLLWRADVNVECWMLMLQKHRSSFSSTVQHSHKIRRNNSQTPHIDFDESIIRFQSKWSIELLLLRQSFTTFRPCLCNGLWWICILFFAVICNVFVSSIFRFAFGSSWLLIFSMTQFLVQQDCILTFFYALKDHSILILYWKS